MQECVHEIAPETEFILYAIDTLGQNTCWSDQLSPAIPQVFQSFPVRQGWFLKKRTISYRDLSVMPQRDRLIDGPLLKTGYAIWWIILFLFSGIGH